MQQLQLLLTKMYILNWLALINPKHFISTGEVVASTDNSPAKKTN